MDMMAPYIENLHSQARTLLEENLIPFWKTNLYNEEDGRFFGYIDRDGNGDPTRPVHAVLMCRALWAFSVAFSQTEDQECLVMADRLYAVLTTDFLDDHFGGIYSETTYEGIALSMQKRTFVQAFFIIAAARYGRVSGNANALESAQDLFALLKMHAQRSVGGFTDVLRRDWSDDEDGHIWWMNRHGAVYIFNSQLHMLEAAIELEEAVPTMYRTHLKEQLEFIANRFYRIEDGHLSGALSVDFEAVDATYAFGNELEAAYLMRRAAALCAAETTWASLSSTMVSKVVEHGWDEVHHGFFFSGSSSAEELNRCKVWWVQAEGLVALIDAYQADNVTNYLSLALQLWQFIETNLVDHEIGELRSSAPNPYTDERSIAQQAARDRRTGREKASAFKCPYHTVRMCVEVLQRLGPALHTGRSH